MLREIMPPEIFRSGLDFTNKLNYVAGALEGDNGCWNSI